VNGSQLVGSDGEQTVMGASYEATFRQYLLLSLGGMWSTSTVVVVGHGMVGHRFVEALRSRDADGAWRVTVLAEETDAAYDRVGLTGYTEHWDRGLLALPGNDFRDDDLVKLRLGGRVTEIDRVAKSVLTTATATRATGR
jgi:nitrite reductase (NADH) large subunit